MIEHSTLFFLMTGIVILLIALSKGGLGGTLGGVATPLMALVMPADQVIGLLLPILMITDLFAVASHWRRWDNRQLFLLVPTSLIGIALGTFFLSGVSELVLRRGLGVIVLLFVLYKLLESRIRARLSYAPRRWHGMLAGATAGFTSTLAHVGGPPIAIYLLMQELSPRTFVATTAVYFAILNWLKVPSYIYADLLDFTQLRQIAALLLLIPVGVLIGRWASTRINKVAFERLVMVMLTVTAVLLFR